MSFVNFTVIDRKAESHSLEIPTDMGLNLMEVIKSHELSEEEIGTCGGMALCASCQVYLKNPSEELKKKSTAEEEMLDQAFFVKENSRLACQIQINDNIKNMVFELAPV